MARPILETLREIRRGALLDEAAAKLQELVTAVTATGKGGTLTLKLSVSPAGRGSQVRTVLIQDLVSLSLPTADREVTVFFPTADGDLSRSDPAQLPLGLRPVESVSQAPQPVAGLAA